MRKICFANQKGGVGKTTLAISMAVGMARKIGDRVLLIDMDPQANATVSCIGPEEPELSIYDVLVKDTPLQKVIRHVEDRLDLVPATIDAAMCEVELLAAVGGQWRLKSRIAEDKPDYDCIVIDCPPSLGLLTINALAAVNEVIVPCTPSSYSVKGLRELSLTIEKVCKKLGQRVRIAGIVLNMEDYTRVSLDTRAELAAQFPGMLFNQGVPKSVKFEESNRVVGKSIFGHAPTSAAAKAIEGLLVEINANG